MKNNARLHKNLASTFNKTINTSPQLIKTATKNAEKQNAFDVIILSCVVVKGNCQTIAKNCVHVCANVH